MSVRILDYASKPSNINVDSWWGTLCCLDNKYVINCQHLKCPLWNQPYTSCLKNHAEHQCPAVPSHRGQKQMAEKKNLLFLEVWSLALKTEQWWEFNEWKLEQRGGALSHCQICTIRDNNFAGIFGIISPNLRITMSPVWCQEAAVYISCLITVWSLLV